MHIEPCLDLSHGLCDRRTGEMKSLCRRCETARFNRRDKDINTLELRDHLIVSFREPIYGIYGSTDEFYSRVDFISEEML